VAAAREKRKKEARKKEAWHPVGLWAADRVAQQ